MWLDVYIYVYVYYIYHIYRDVYYIYTYTHVHVCIHVSIHHVCTHVCNKCMYIFCKCVEYTCTFMREFNSETGCHQWWVRGQWLVHAYRTNVTYTEWTAVVSHGSTVLGVFTNLFHEIPIIPMIFPALTIVNHRMVVPQSSSKSWMTMT